jgi:hypothetical protein
MEMIKKFLLTILTGIFVLVAIEFLSSCNSDKSEENGFDWGIVSLTSQIVKMHPVKGKYFAYIDCDDYGVTIYYENKNQLVNHIFVINH